MGHLNLHDGIVLPILSFTVSQTVYTNPYVVITAELYVRVFWGSRATQLASQVLSPLFRPSQDPSSQLLLCFIKEWVTIQTWLVPCFLLLSLYHSLHANPLCTCKYLISSLKAFPDGRRSPPVQMTGFQ